VAAENLVGRFAGPRRELGHRRARAVTNHDGNTGAEADLYRKLGQVIALLFLRQSRELIA